MKLKYKQILTHIGIPILLGGILTVLIIFFSRFKQPSQFNWHLLLFITVSVVIIWYTFYFVVITKIKTLAEVKLKSLVWRFGIAMLLGVGTFDILYAIIKWIDFTVYKSHEFLTVGHLIAASGVGLFSVFIIGGIETGYFFIIYWLEAKILNTRNEKELNQIKLHLLRQQLDPHFIFNSFSTLDGLIHRDTERASQFLHQLSAFYHQVINTYDENLISLRNELQLVKTYVEILELRFGNGLQIRYDISESLLDYKIPPLCIQLLIENAIKHNTIADNEKLFITIRNENLSIIVKNKKRLKNVSIKSSKIGLSNLKKRFALHQSQFLISETSHDFSITFDLIA